MQLFQVLRLYPINLTHTAFAHHTPLRLQGLVTGAHTFGVGADRALKWIGLNSASSADPNTYGRTRRPCNSRDLWLVFRRPATCIRFCSMVSETASTYVSRNGSFFAQEKWKIWLTRRTTLNTLSLAHPPAFDLAVRWPSM